MSQRETVKKPISILSIAGVNQRTVATELDRSQFSNIVGVFPGNTGQQVKLPGKRLLKKYTDPIWSIFQFWTPVGYGFGLYQFRGKVDGGNWITPTSNILVPPLPPFIPIDGGGLTVDEFGDYFGGPIGTTNVCAISYTGTGSEHSGCGTELDVVGTPDDTNGGPAGQGTSCSWQQSEHLYTDMDMFITAMRYGDTGPMQVTFPIPGPEHVPLGPTPEVSNYITPTPPNAPYMTAAKANGSYWTNVGSGYIGHNDSSAKAGHGTLEFSAIDSDPTISQIQLVYTQRQFVPLIGNRTKTVDIPTTRGEDGHIMPFDFDMNGLLDFSQTPQDTGDGYAKVSDVIVEGVKVIKRVRVCA